MNVTVRTEAITRHQKSRCMTRNKLAEASGVGIATVKKLGSDKYLSISSTTLQKLADALGLETEPIIASREELEEHKKNLQALIDQASTDRARKKYNRQLETLERIMNPQHA